MPAIPSSATILISGVSGFIPIHTAKLALQKGFTVVGTVRSEAKGEYVKKVLNSDRFSYTIVKDISQPNAFDEAVKVAKFSGVLHMASPFHAKATDPDEIYKPALNGTQSILESIHQYAPDVKRVVITSSFAAIVKPYSTKLPYTYSEKDFNKESPAKVEEMQKEGKTEGIGAVIYTASKALAEERGWDFVKEHKPNFDLATINPAYVLGAADQDVPNAEALNTSNNVIYQIMLGNLKKEDLPGASGSYVHVTDVAEAHVEALLREEAGGQRYMLADRPFTKQEVAEILTKIDPSIKVPEGEKGAAQSAITADKVPQLDHSKVEKELGVKFRGLEECVKDVYHSIKEKEKEWKKA